MFIAIAIYHLGGGLDLQVLWVPGMVVFGGGGFDFAEVLSGVEVVLGGHFVLDVVGCNL